MIRTAWVAVTAVIVTLFYGIPVVIASLLRVRGRFYFWCARLWSRAILRASGVPVAVHGMERIDWGEPQVLVSNHISWYDVFALASVLPVPFHFVGKKELDRIPFFGTVWRLAGHISIDRSDRQKAMESMRRAAEKIHREPGVVVIFPEGTRSRTGELLPFKRGAFVLAVQARVRVIPVMVRGSERVLRPGSRRVHSHPIDLYFADPVSLRGPDETADELLERVRSRMLRMLPG